MKRRTPSKPSVRRALKMLAVSALIGAPVLAGLPEGGSSDAGGALVAFGAQSVLPGIPGATLLGPLAPTTPISTVVVLKPRDQRALDAFVASVSTPDSPHYGHYLTVGQFGPRFGATPAALNSVIDTLRSVGLKPSSVTPDDLLIPVSATASQLSRAFGVSFSRWRLASGRVAIDYRGTPLIPPAVSADIGGIIGLSTVDAPAPRLAVMADTTTTPMAGVASACPAALRVDPEHQGLHDNGHPGDQFLPVDRLMKAYGADPLYDVGDLGQGITIDVFEGEANFPSDITTYESCFGIRTPVRYFPVAGGAPAPSVANEDGLETELDVETLASVAPRATIDVYQSDDTNVNDVTEYAAMIDADEAQVISSSWGECEDAALLLSTDGFGFLNAEQELFEQAAAQGMSFTAAAGDSGSEDCALRTLPSSILDPLNPIDYQEVDDPASDPYVTGVGGTHLTVTPTGERNEESVWNDGPSSYALARGAGGGGESHYWAMPPWQYGTLVSRNWLPSLLSTTSVHAECPVALNDSVNGYCREVPDVTANADPASGLVIYWAGSWTHVGGTSAGAPQWAGLAALADSCAEGWGLKPVGFLNPALYAIAESPTRYAQAFYDINSGNNDYADPTTHIQGYVAGSGYDMASGLGSPIAGTGNDGVVDQLCAGAPHQ